MENELKNEEIEQKMKKWEGTGLEDDVFKEYMRPQTKQQSRFVIHKKIKSKPKPVSERDLDIPETREVPVDEEPGSTSGF